LRASFHPKAFLSQKRNVKLGLVARTRIIQALEKAPSNVRNVGNTAGLNYNVVLHHLRLLEAERVVTRRGNRPFMWELTGVGQQRLSNLKAH